MAELKVNIKEQIPISNVPPPNYVEIIKALPDANFFKDSVFAYAPNIHSIRPIPGNLYEHEKVHIEQQGKIGGAKIWWEKFLSTPSFRLEQELEAYRAQYAYAKKRCKDRNELNRFLIRLSREISSAQYGFIIKQSSAMRMIKQ